MSSITLNVADFGVRPDGQVSAVTNSTGLFAMRDRILELQQEAGPDSAAPHFSIFFPPGLYQIDHPDWAPSAWAAGPLKYTINAYGVRFQNLKSGGSGTGARHPMTGTSPFLIRSRYTLAGNWIEGYDINTVEAGSLEIVLKDAAQAVNFSVGGRALIYGFETQGSGGPPNCRYFEWLTVKEIAGPQITFEEPLLYRYDDQWPLTGQPLSVTPSGPGKIVSLDSVYSDDGTEDMWYPIYQEINGMEIVPNPNAGGYDSIQLPGHVLYTNDMVHQNFAPTVTKTTIAKRCKFVQKLEGDKICQHVEFRDCEHRAPLVGFTGCRNVIVSGGMLNIGDWIDPDTTSDQVRGERFLLENCDVYGYGQATPSTSMLGNSGNWPQRQAIFRNNQFHVRSDQNPPAAFGRNVPHTVTVDAVGASGELLITQNDANANIWRKIEIGRPLYNQATGDCGVIKAMDADGTWLRIAGDWVVVPEVGQIWQQHQIGKVEGENNVLVPRAGDHLRFDMAPWHSWESGTKKVCLSSIDMDFGRGAVTPTANDVWGYIKRIQIDVLTASSGGQLELNIFQPDGTSYGIKTVDLTTISRRVIDENTIEGAPTDSLDQLGLGKWAGSFSTRILGGFDRVSVELCLEIAGPI